MDLRCYLTFYGSFVLALQAAAFNLIGGGRRDLGPNHLPENPMYYGYSLIMYETPDAKKGFFIGAPKTINATRSSSSQEPKGSIIHCSPSNLYPNWNISCKATNLSRAEEGDNFGGTLKITSQKMIMACSPTRVLACDTVKYMTGVCYNSKDEGYSWKDLSQNLTSQIECPIHDVLFLLDGSESIGKSNFDRIKTWVINVSKEILNVTGDSVRFGVVQYSDYYENQAKDKLPTREIEMQLFLNHIQFSSALNELEYFNAQTYTGHALEKMKSKFQQSPNFGKNTTKQVLILLTDGEADDSDFVPKASDDLRKLGVILYAVGVGKDVNKEQLRVIANGNKSDNTRTFMINDYDGLSQVAQELKAGIAALLLDGQRSPYRDGSQFVPQQIGFSAAIGRSSRQTKNIPYTKQSVQANGMDEQLIEILTANRKLRQQSWRK